MRRDKSHSGLAVENAITIPPPLGTDAGRFLSINCHVDSTDAWESILDVMACPELCEEIRSGRGQQIEILFGCATEPSIIR